MQHVDIQPLDTNPLLKKMMTRADIEVTPKKYWSDLDALYQSIGQGIVELMTSVSGTSQMLVGKTFPNMSETTATIIGLSRDLEDLSQTLRTIYDRHSMYNGAIADIDQNNLATDCFQDYHAAATRLTTLTMQPMITITEAISEVAAQERSNVNAETIKFAKNGDIIGTAERV